MTLVGVSLLTLFILGHLQATDTLPAAAPASSAVPASAITDAQFAKLTTQISQQPIARPFPERFATLLGISKPGQPPLMLLEKNMEDASRKHHAIAVLGKNAGYILIYQAGGDIYDVRIDEKRNFVSAAAFVRPTGFAVMSKPDAEFRLQAELSYWTGVADSMP